MLRLARLRRIAALAAPLLLLQLAVAGAAGTCPLGDDMGGAPMAMSHSDGLHAGHDASTGTAHDPAPAAPANHHHSASRCDMACAPASCGAAGHCATSAVSSSSTPAVALASAHGRRIIGHDGAPRSVSTAPEPPPPRAWAPSNPAQ